MKRVSMLVSVIVVLGLLLSSGSVLGQEPGTPTKDEADTGLALTAIVASKMSYQGVLKKGDSPANGTFDMTFTLYNSSTCTDPPVQTINMAGVKVENGLFTVGLEVNKGYFTGQALWLRAKVGDSLFGCQEIMPVPYALTVRPGALIFAEDNYYALFINNKGTGDGLRTYVNTTSPYYAGVYAVNNGTGTGLFGIAQGGTAVRGQANQQGGIGVYGSALYSGSDMSKTYGGYFVSNSRLGTGVYAKVGYPGSGAKYAGYFEVDSETGWGVYSTVRGQYTSWAVRGEQTGGTPTGGVGGGWFSTDSANGVGVMGQARASGGTGGYFYTDGGNGIGVKAIASGSNSVGLYATGTRYAGDFSGNVAIRSRTTGSVVIELGEGLDYAEGFDVSTTTAIEPGTVLVIDPEAPGQLTISTTPYDTRVAGIVAGANGLSSAIRLGAGSFDYDVALAGRVYCNVDATLAAIEAGDLLTTSALPGYAMKASDYDLAKGAVLGKAMEPLAQGERGQILVLVTLQ